MFYLLWAEHYFACLEIHFVFETQCVLRFLGERLSREQKCLTVLRNHSSRTGYRQPALMF